MTDICILKGFPPSTSKGFKPKDLIPTVQNKMTICYTIYQHWTCRSSMRI